MKRACCAQGLEYIQLPTDASVYLTCSSVYTNRRACCTGNLQSVSFSFNGSYAPFDETPLLSQILALEEANALLVSQNTVLNQVIAYIASENSQDTTTITNLQTTLTATSTNLTQETTLLSTCLSDKNALTASYNTCNSSFVALQAVVQALNSSDTFCVQNTTASLAAQLSGCYASLINATDLYESETLAFNVEVILYDAEVTNLTSVYSSLDTCLSSLDTTSAELTTTTDSLTTCTASLSSETSQFSSCNSTLATTNSTLQTTTQNLATCTANLASETAQFNTCSANLVTCNQNLTSQISSLGMCITGWSATNGTLFSTSVSLVLTNQTLVACASNLTTEISAYGSCTQGWASTNATQVQCSASLASCISGWAQTNVTLENELASYDVVYVYDEVCAANLTTVSSNLTQCQSNLATCNSNLATETSNYNNAESLYFACSGNLASANANLTTCQANVVSEALAYLNEENLESACIGYLATCDSNLATQTSLATTCATNLAAQEAANAGCLATLASTNSSLVACNATQVSLTSQLNACNTSLISETASEVACNASLISTTANLLSCNSSQILLTYELGQCNSSLAACATCTSSLAACQGSLSSTNASLISCNQTNALLTSELSNCTTSLGEEETYYSDCSSELSACTANLATETALYGGCSTSLSLTNASLISEISLFQGCNTSLSSTSASLTACQTSLSATSATLLATNQSLQNEISNYTALLSLENACVSMLAACNIELASETSYDTQCDSSLSFCQSSLTSLNTTYYLLLANDTAEITNATLCSVNYAACSGGWAATNISLATCQLALAVEVANYTTEVGLETACASSLTIMTNNYNGCQAFLATETALYNTCETYLTSCNGGWASTNTSLAAEVALYNGCTASLAAEISAFNTLNATYYILLANDTTEVSNYTICAGQLAVCQSGLTAETTLYNACSTSLASCNIGWSSTNTSLAICNANYTTLNTTYQATLSNDTAVIPLYDTCAANLAAVSPAPGVPEFTAYDLVTSSPAVGLYGLRQLIQGYSGYCMIVYRASDGTYQSIGFVGSGELDLLTLATFCRGTTCRVSHWYDQSGSGNDFVQATISSMPYLTLNCQGQLPCLYFDGTGVQMNSTAAFVFQSIAFIASFNYRVADYVGLIGWSGNAAYADVGVRLGLHGTSYILPGFTGNDFDYTGVFFANGVSGGTVYNGSLAQIYESGFNGLSGNYVGLGNYAIETNRWWDGNVMELALYQWALSTNDQQAVSTDQGRNWNVTVTGSASTLPALYDTSLFSTQLSTPSIFLSTRLVVLTYTGPLINVRRSSDNTATDIYADVNGNLNQVTLLAFVGSGNGYVTTWYDQSYGRNHAHQITAAYQPQIVSSGVVLTANGRPAIQFTGSGTTYLSIATFSDTTTTIFSSTIASMTNNALANGRFLSFTSGSTDDCCSVLTFVPGQRTGAGATTVAANRNVAGVTSASFALNTLHSFQSWVDGSNINVALDYTASTPTATSGNFSITAVGIGADLANLGGATHWDGLIGEVLASVSIPSTTARGAILSNQQAYWGIPTLAQSVLGITAPAVVLSVRLVVPTYTGPLIQVRRSSDNTVLNVYSDGNGNLNSSALATWVGSGNNGYISIWYDQSGGANHAYQTTNANQPQIVASGVVITKNGQPAPTFTSSSTMGITGFTDTTNNVFASSVFAMSTVPLNYSPVLGLSSGSSVSCYNNANDIGFFFSLNSGQLSSLRQGLVQINANGMTYGPVQVASVAISGATHVISLDGTSTSYTTTSTAFSGSYVQIGGCPGYAFVGSISEIILTTNVPTSIQQAELLAGQQAYFTVPTPRFTLDRVSATPLAAYGLRQLRSGYTGPAFIVRATNTGASTSIYFLADGTLDLTTLQQLCVGTTCYITTWYDQTGNGYTMSQSTTSLQPQLLLADPVSVYYPGYSSATILANSGGISNVVAISAVLQADTIPPPALHDCCQGFTGMSGANDRSVRGFYATNQNTFTWETNTGNTSPNGGFMTTNTYVDNYMNYYMSANNLHTFHTVGGTNWNSATCTTTNTPCTFNNIGGISQSGDRYWPGLINEVIYWGTVPSSADQTTVYQDQHRLCQTVNQTALDVSAARAANQTTAVYGMRQVLSSYRGSLMRVSRSTDATMMDIPFLWNGLMDTGLLNNFCAGTSTTCFIVYWYDQTGNGYDLVQPIWGKQLPIVLNNNNGLPAISCPNNILLYLQTVANFDPTTVTAVQSINSGAVAIAGLIGWPSGNDGVELRIDNNSPGSHVGWNTGTLSAGDWDYNTPNIFVDNAFTATQATTSTHSVSTGGANGPSSGYPINLCAPAYTPTARPFYGAVSEVILATLASPYAFNISDRATLFLEQAYIYGISNPFLLDKLSSTANAAYSLRRLKASYTGYCIQVQRASDSTSANIGFTTTGLLDTTTLGTFCYNTTCSVQTWYDQSGNGYNGVTYISGELPPIVYIGQNAQPYLNFYTDSVTRFPQFEITASTTFSSVNMVLAWQTGTVSPSNTYMPVLFTTSSSLQGITLAVGSPPAGYSAIGTRDTICSAMYVDNVNTVSQAASTQPSSVYCPTSSALTLGGIGPGESTYVGQFWEVIAWNTALSTADQNTVYYNQKGFWGTG